MTSTLFTTGATLKAILCFIDPEKTPKIAYDKDEYAEPLRNKIKLALKNANDADGSQDATISFNDEEEELERQFKGVCRNISEIFTYLDYD